MICMGKFESWKVSFWELLQILQSLCVFNADSVACLLSGILSNKEQENLVSSWILLLKCDEHVACVIAFGLNKDWVWIFNNWEAPTSNDTVEKCRTVENFGCNPKGLSLGYQSLWSRYASACAMVLHKPFTAIKITRNHHLNLEQVVKQLKNKTHLQNYI